MKKLFLAIIVIISILLNSTVLAANNSILAATKIIKINERNVKVNIVTIDLNNPFIELKVEISNDVIGGDEDFISFINRKKMDAAINTNYFEAYTNLEPCGTIMKDGELIYLEGNNTSMAITKDNNVIFDRFTTIIKGSIDGKLKNEWNKDTQKMKFYLFDVWYVNKKPVDKTGVYIYTPERGNIKAEGGILIEVIKNKVTRILKNVEYIKIPSNGYVIYFASKSVSEDFIKERFKIGKTVNLKYESFYPKNDSLFSKNNKLSRINLNKMKGLISAGPYLIRNGKIIVDGIKEGFKEEKITKNKANRSAIGLIKNNKLILVTTLDVTINELAQIMLNLGCFEAINLDGGASSALYANNKIITKPSRKLSTILSIYNRDELKSIHEKINNKSFNSIKEIIPYEKDIIDYTVFKFSDIEYNKWYTKIISYLVGLNILDGYSDSTFRPNDYIHVDEFLKITLTALGNKLELSKDYWAKNYIEKALELGLIEKNDFKSFNTPITREQIAKIVVKLIRENPSYDLYIYKNFIKDFNNIDKNLQESVLKVYGLGIISGYNDKTFKPKNPATRAEAASVIIRLLDENNRISNY